ncbi:MAG: methionine adenosyltransferase [Bacteroidales bacterium]|nr:methionine adenosyltransferase [Bacteroidales bacterium]NLM92830.1 methionine adenosyltransferase [Bacteroidales bacterium]
MGYLFTSESVSEGHPDKVADQISDALLDEFLRQDPNSKVACETMVTTGLVVCGGEVKTDAYVDIQSVVRDVLKEIGYTDSALKFEAESCGVISALHEQSPDIRQGVERRNEQDQGAGDQGMMFGYASRETDEYMPLSLDLSHILLQQLARIRKEGKVMTYLRPDSKSQVTIEYDEGHQPVRIETIVISTQHDEFELPADDSDEAREVAEKNMQDKITEDILKYLIPAAIEELPERIRPLFKNGYRLLVNPTGKFVIGGPHGDTGLTGRKIIVDTYGGKGAHGGGAFSGKDASKVDRSAAYAARHIARNMVAAGIADEVLVQLAYAIGVADPVGVYVNTYGTARVNMSDGQIARKIRELFDLRPFAIIHRFGLKNPIFKRTTTYGHFGRSHYSEKVEVFYDGPGVEEVTLKMDGRTVKKKFKEVEFFAWEKEDYVDILKNEFGL